MFPTFVLYELTILLVLTLTLVIMKVRHFFFFFLPFLILLLALSSLIVSSASLSVHDGCAGAFSTFASGFPTYTLGGFSWPGSGQRILLRFKQPSTARWHHLQRGQ